MELETTAKVNECKVLWEPENRCSLKIFLQSASLIFEGIPPTKFTMNRKEK